MDEYAYIRTAHRVYGKSIRAIARETKHDRKTVKKALKGQAPTYTVRVSQPYPVLGPYREIIDAWLGGDREVSKKQRHTAVRIYTRLVSEYGYVGSESAVRRYVREAKLQLGITLSRAFIPCEADLLSEAEVDWGTADIYLRDKLTRVKVFCMRSKYSGRIFVRVYPCERQQAFFDAHIHAFAFFGGVFRTIIYDNLTTAVLKVLKGRDRLEQKEFAKFHAHYNFVPRFCNPASGHEKGGVEGIVGFSRRNFLVPIPHVESLEEFNEQLLRDCLAYGTRRIDGRDRTVEELFEEEKATLLPLTDSAFSNLQTVDSKVNGYATVRVDFNRYSVPTRYVGYKVNILLHVDRIKIYYGGKVIASHERCFSKGKWSLDPQHYLELLKQRPMAFDAARPIRAWRATWPEALEKLLAHLRHRLGDTAGIKDFVAVLMLIKEYGQDEVGRVSELALKIGSASADSIRQLLLGRHQGPPPERLAAWSPTEPTDLSAYDKLGKVI